MIWPGSVCVPEPAMMSPAAIAAVIELPTLRITALSQRIAILRLWKPRAEHFSALSEVFGLPWPSAPNRAAGSDTRVLWLAPDTWAIVGQPEWKSRQYAARALGERLHHVSEVSDGRVVFSVSGARARALLSKGCSLDLHPREFCDGQCAQSLLAQVPVLIEPVALSEAHAIDYRLYADVSYGGYLRAWFADAAQEYS
jgi:sarcosine oxidase, subunit gamma